MRKPIPLLATAVLWTSAALSQQPPTFAERLTTHVGNIEVEYEAADSGYLDALKSLFASLAANGLPPSPRPPFGFRELESQRTEILNQIAAQLALPQPTPKLEEVYDKGVSSFNQVREKLRLGMPSRYALWHKEDLKARLRAGQKIEGHQLEGDGAAFKLDLNFQGNLDQPPEEAIRAIDATWAKVVWPVFIGEKTAQEDVKASFRQLFQVKSSISTLEAMGVLAVLHGAVGEAIEEGWFTETEARWFQEGVTTWLTVKIVSDRVTPADARRYYDPVAVMKRVPSATGTNLEKWVVSDAEKSLHRGAFNDGNQARAMMVIRGMVAAKGEDIIPKLLAELGTQKKRDLPAVYAAFEKLTGEDMRSYLTMVTANET